MGTAYNPRIVTDGLVLCLDAANTKSYPGSGTTWTDLSGNGNNGTLTNGPTFDSSNGGSIVFDGANDGVQLTHNSSWVINSADNFSVAIWFFTTSSTGTQILFSHQKCNNPAYQLFISAGILNARVNTIINSNINVVGSWNYAVMTYTGSDSSIKCYLNGNLVQSGINSTSWSSYSPGHSEVWLGRRFPCALTDEFTGKISQFSYYKNKILLPQEIQQNFQATRGRYGI
jgi:hypothetical protein